uniref:Putative secreted protein n=1 Tax=Anopheles darlingi TaxID=43151 RepID=A0A2M4DCZ6_ANODA
MPRHRTRTSLQARPVFGGRLVCSCSSCSPHLIAAAVTTRTRVLVCVCARMHLRFCFALQRRPSSSAAASVT